MFGLIKEVRYEGGRVGGKYILNAEKGVRNRIKYRRKKDNCGKEK